MKMPRPGITGAGTVERLARLANLPGQPVADHEDADGHTDARHGGEDRGSLIGDVSHFRAGHRGQHTECRQTENCECFLHRSLTFYLCDGPANHCYTPVTLVLRGTL